MAGEESPLMLKRCITGGLTAEGEVSASEDHLPKPCNPKRKMGAATATAAAAEADQRGAADEKEEKALEKRMTRLPQEEVDWILDLEFRAPRDFEALRHSNPGLTPPPGEEMDESTRLFYEAARIFYDGQESFFKFQDEVRRQYEEKRYVEVDEEYLANNRAYNRAMISETWQEVCGDRAYSDDDDGCTYLDTDDESVFTLQ